MIAQQIENIAVMADYQQCAAIFGKVIFQPEMLPNQGGWLVHPTAKYLTDGTTPRPKAKRIRQPPENSQTFRAKSSGANPKPCKISAARASAEAAPIIFRRS